MPSPKRLHAAISLARAIHATAGSGEGFIPSELAWAVVQLARMQGLGGDRAAGAGTVAPPREAPVPPSLSTGFPQEAPRGV